MGYVEIVGFEGLYKINKLGCIVNRHGKQIKHRVGISGYPRVNLYIGDGKPITKQVHALVATAFITNVDDKKCINHIDGDKTNCNAGNLEWCTHQENIIHAVSTGLVMHESLVSRSKLGASKRARFTEDEASEICEMHESLGLTRQETANAIGCNVGTIRLLLTGVTTNFRVEV